MLRFSRQPIRALDLQIPRPCSNHTRIIILPLLSFTSRRAKITTIYIKKHKYIYNKKENIKLTFQFVYTTLNNGHIFEIILTCCFFRAFFYFFFILLRIIINRMIYFIFIYYIIHFNLKLKIIFNFIYVNFFYRNVFYNPFLGISIYIVKYYFN